MSVQLYWKRVIFSDETQVGVGHDRRVHVWRKADEIWRPECVGLKGGPRVAVMFWGCFFTSLTRIFLFKMSHLEFCSLILIVLHTFSIMFKSGD
jgi:hypothetical protein